MPWIRRFEMKAIGLSSLLTAFLAVTFARAAAGLELTSAAFSSGGTIPTKYTCDGRDISPPLQWRDPPRGTVSLALIMGDPDAPVGTWVHWVIYNLPATASSLPQAVPTDPQLTDGTRQGRNSWNNNGDGGPCPPGGTHRYFFKLYALNSQLNLKPGATKRKLLKAMKGHILSKTELMGRYNR
jgi:hypothetical protein